MFKKLRNKIILITMATTTAVLIAAGVSIMFFSSTMRPEPRPFPELMIIESDFSSQEIREYIKIDRNDGSMRLLATLLSVGLAIEIVVFWISYYFSRKIVEPVKDSYEKQKLFIANASHELKTPLAVIQANMEALDVDEANAKWVGNIETEINHANKLVLDLLQLAKMDAGKIEKSQVEKFDLPSELDSRIQIFKPKFAGKMSLKSKAESREYVLPRQDLVQVVDILLDNATKYGEKKISVLLENKTITVTNDGAVIPKEDLEKVFDRFYQTDKTKEGSGLGLAIAKAICTRNGWRITCESGNKLTKFIIAL